MKASGILISVPSDEDTAPIDLNTGRRVSFRKRQEEEADADPDVPRPRSRPQREDSRSMAMSAIDKADALVRERFGSGLSDEAKVLVADFVEEKLEQLVRQISKQKEPQASLSSTDRTRPWSSTDSVPRVERQRTPVAWFVVACLSVFLFIGTLVITWEKIKDVEERQKSDIEAVENRQDSDDAYGMIVANWLVIDSASDYDRAINIDTMLRTIASQIGANVSDVPKPVQTHPPTAIQHKSSAYELSQGR